MKHLPWILLLTGVIMATFSMFGTNTSITVAGDEQGCRAYLGEANKLLYQLRMQNKTGVYALPEVKYSDGTTIKVWGAAGRDYVKILKPLIGGKERVIESQEDRLIVVGYINHRSDENGVAIWFDDNLKQLKEVTIPSKEMSGATFPPGPQKVVCDTVKQKAFSADPYNFVHKYDMKKMVIESTLNLAESTEWDISLQAINANMGDKYFYVGLATYPGSFKRIDTDTFNVVGTYELMDGASDNTQCIVSTPYGIITNGTRGVLEWVSDDLSKKGSIALPNLDAYVYLPSSTYSDKTKTAYVCQDPQANRYVVAINAETGSVIAQSITFPGILTVANTDKKGNVYVGYWGPPVNDYIIKFDSELNTFIQSPQLGYNQRIAGITASTDGKHIYVATYRKNTATEWTTTDGFILYKLRASDLSIAKQVTVSNRYALGLDLCPLDPVKTEIKE